MESSGCIFCGGSAEADHREHILPDSLGGDAWEVLPPGLVCKSCNNYFGSKVEQRALSTFPFLLLRVLLGVPTKKRKQPWTDVIQGRVIGSGTGGILQIAPRTLEMRRGIEGGAITTMRMLGQVTEPEAVCQLLLKIGLEIIAYHNAELARTERYDAARKIARCPVPGDKWAFLIVTDDAAFDAHLRNRPSITDTLSRIDFGVSNIEGGDFICLSMPGFEFICPLEPHTVDESLRHLPPRTHVLHEVLFGRRH